MRGACQAESGHAFSDAHSQCRICWHMEESGTEGMEAAVEAKIQILEHFWSKVDELCGVLPGRWEEFHRVFRTIKHFKDFMAMEIGLDMVANPGSLISDTSEWTPMGPGGLRGLNYVFGRKRAAHVEAPMEMMKALRHAMAKLDPMYATWPLHEFQFALCEFDKFTRPGQSQLRFYFPTAPTPKEYLLVKSLNKAMGEKFELEKKMKELQARLGKHQE